MQTYLLIAYYPNHQSPLFVSDSSSLLALAHPYYDHQFIHFSFLHSGLLKLTHDILVIPNFTSRTNTRTKIQRTTNTVELEKLPLLRGGRTCAGRQRIRFWAISQFLRMCNPRNKKAQWMPQLNTNCTLESISRNVLF